MNIQLKNRREERGLTQGQVALKSGVTVVAYQRYETEKRIPSVRTAIRIARTLNSTVEALFGAATPAIGETPDGNRANQ